LDVILRGYKTVLLKTGKWSYYALLDLGVKNYKNMSVFEAVHVLPDLGKQCHLVLVHGLYVRRIHVLYRNTLIVSNLEFDGRCFTTVMATGVVIPPMPPVCSASWGDRAD
jgi:hypothetical protein